MDGPVTAVDLSATTIRKAACFFRPTLFRRMVAGMLALSLLS